MRRLLLKGFVFLAAAAAVLDPLSAFILRRQVLAEGLGLTQDGRHVYDAVYRSRKPSTATMAAVGDSVALQIVARQVRTESRVLNLATYFSVSMAGQYLLVRNALQSQPHLKAIVLVCHPMSFSNDLDHRWIYPHFVKPLVFADTLDVLTPHTRARLGQSPWFALYPRPLAKTFAWTPVTDYGAFARGPRPPLAPTSVEYLRIIADTCRARGVAFRVHPVPVDGRRTSDLDKLRRAVAEAGLHPLLGDYFADLETLDPSYFQVDRIHIRGDHLDEIARHFQWWWRDEASSSSPRAATP
jgi:hypothetical protein